MFSGQYAYCFCIPHSKEFSLKIGKLELTILSLGALQSQEIISMILAEANHHLEACEDLSFSY